MGGLSLGKVYMSAKYLTVKPFTIFIALTKLTWGYISEKYLVKWNFGSLILYLR
jgi:hypothetical protein